MILTKGFRVMSEAKWRSVDELTAEVFDEGSWMRTKDGMNFTTDEFRNKGYHAFVLKCREDRMDMVFGPIPPKPKAPPKLRRFTAKHESLGIIAGVFCKDEPESNGRDCFAFYWLGDKAVNCLVDLKSLTDIQWLDEE